MIKKVYRSFVYLFILLFFASCQNQVEMQDLPFPTSFNNNQKEGITYNITYKNVDGLDNPNPTIYGFTKDVTLKPVLKDGYGFIDWYTSPTFEPSTVITGWKAYEMSADLVLYAKYDQEVFNIIYHNVDGFNNPNPKTYNIKNSFTLQPASKTGYKFLGWYQDSSYTGNPVSSWGAGTYTKDLVFYAKWTLLDSFNISDYGISNFGKWLNENIDTNRNDNKVKISGNATEDDLRTISLQIKNVEKYIEEMDLSDLNVAQFYNSNRGADREKGFMSGLTNVKKIILPASLKILSEGAFSYCDNLEEIVINEGVTDMLWSAFSNCTKLKEVTIPDSVEFLAQTAFYYCTSLEKVNISKNSNLEILGLSLFRHCTKLTEFYFPSKVVLLDSRAATRSRGNAQSNANNNGSFLECTGLTTLTFSKNIKQINNRVFEGCNKITTINFEGTPEEWAAVQIGSNNGSLLSATVNYNYVIQ